MHTGLAGAGQAHSPGEAVCVGNGRTQPHSLTLQSKQDGWSPCTMPCHPSKWYNTVPQAPRTHIRESGPGGAKVSTQTPTSQPGLRTGLLPMPSPAAKPAGGWHPPRKRAKSVGMQPIPGPWMWPGHSSRRMKAWGTQSQPSPEPGTATQDGDTFQGQDPGRLQRSSYTDRPWPPGPRRAHPRAREPTFPLSSSHLDLLAYPALDDDSGLSSRQGGMGNGSATVLGCGS